jgi:hypothetical protein
LDTCALSGTIDALLYPYGTYRRDPSAIESNDHPRDETRITGPSDELDAMTVEL